MATPGPGDKAEKAARTVVSNTPQLDRASVLGLAVGDGGAFVNALMRASNIVNAVGELTQHPLQMGVIEDEKMIEAFLSGGTDPSFGEGICIGSLKGCEENVDALADEDSIESIRELDIWMISGYLFHVEARMRFSSPTGLFYQSENKPPG